MTTSAPAARSFDASAAIAGPSGATRSPCTLAARVDRSASIVITPDDADVDAGRLARAPMAGRSATRPAGRSRRRSGSPRGRDSAPARARALSAPRRSPGSCRAAGESTEPKSKSWLPTASAVYPMRVVGVDDEGALAQIRLGVALKRVAGVDQQHRPAVRRPGGAQVVHVSREQGQTAAAVSRKRRPVKIAGADNRGRHQRRRVRRGPEARQQRPVAADARNASASAPEPFAASRSSALPPSAGIVDVPALSISLFRRGEAGAYTVFIYCDGFVRFTVDV
mgnify:CR=1 FL=1